MSAQALTREGRQTVNEFIKATGLTHGGQDATQQFTIEPSVLQTLNELISLDGQPFLQQINVVGVPELKGQKIFLGQGGLVSKRTLIDATHERVPVDPVTMTDASYELFQVETDVAITYAMIDVWAKFPNFAALWNEVVRKKIGNDRLRVGWHGTSAATLASTDPVTNPNGEDLLVGWLEQIRQWNSGSQYVEGTTAGTPPTYNVVLGSTTYPNLDYLVSVTKARIDPVYLNDPSLVALISQNLALYEEAHIYQESGRLPVQKLPLTQDPTALLRNYGGLPSYSPPFLPDGVILITPLKNLSIYYQSTSWRRMIRDWAPKNRYEDFSSRNEGYVVEDPRATSLVDGVTLET